VESRKPESCTELFWVFTAMALQGFGGVLPVAERVLVHERQWMGQKEFVETLAIAQALPGPNIINMSLMVGDRHFGARGAAAAIAGMLVVPMMVVLCVAAVYQTFADRDVVKGMLLGMGATAVGLIGGMALRLVRTQGDYRWGWVFGVLTFVAMAVAHLKLAWVLLLCGLPSFLVRYWQRRKDHPPTRGPGGAAPEV
jgi:chromate transporter